MIRNIGVIDVSPTEVELSFTDEGSEIFSLEQILQLKEEDWFNRGVALSQDCCDSIATKAKEKLFDLRNQFPNTNHQIIASAISKRHAREFVKPAFEKIGLKVEMVSSDSQDKKKNDSVFNKLKSGQIDTIIHIGMLGEGFDHPPLGVAAIFRPYKSLNPYIQFLGRAIRRHDKADICFVVSHIGLNQITRFKEFKMFDYEDQQFFEELFLSQVVNEQKFVNDSEPTKEKETQSTENTLSIREVGDNQVNFKSHFIEQNPVDNLVGQVEQLSDEEKKKLFEKLGINVDTQMSVDKKNTRVKPVEKRKASRNLLNEREKSITSDILKSLNLSYKGRDFNKMFDNFKWIIKRVKKEVNTKLGINVKQRKNIKNIEFEDMEKNGILDQVKTECLDYFNEKINPTKNL